jgi:hypothetical protein
MTMLRRLAPIAVIALMVSVAGCNKEPVTSQADDGEIKGAPIDSAPVEIAASEPTAEAVPVEIETVDTAKSEAPAEQQIAAASEAEKIVSAEPVVNADGKINVTFAFLGSYTYQYPDLHTKAEDGSPLPLPDQIPAKIKELNGKKVSIEGFMLPSEIEKGKIKSFILLKDIMGCCFGMVPMMNEWVFVKMAGDTTCEFTPDVPITVDGTLEVGEEIKDDTVMSLYRLIADKVHPPKLQQIWETQPAGN